MTIKTILNSSHTNQRNNSHELVMPHITINMLYTLKHINNPRRTSYVDAYCKRSLNALFARHLIKNIRNKQVALTLLGKRILKALT